MKVLVVEDDVDLRGSVERRLRTAGFAVDTAADLDEANVAVDVGHYDCLVLDRAVPGGDTIGLVRRLRRETRATPALFLTARDAVADRVEGFQAGGDDYLVKPFAMDELVARVRSLCRRGVQAAPTVLELGDLQMNQSRAEVRRGGVLLPLTAKELCVLSYLMINARQVVSRTALIDHCWDELTDPMSNTVEVHVASLRRKLGAPQIIHTARGLGYMLDDNRPEAPG